jgi:carboxyl-terminal processing protease
VNLKLHQSKKAGRLLSKAKLVLLASLLCGGCCPHFEQSQAPPQTYLTGAARAEDFDAAWEFIQKEDCWLPQQPVDWLAAKTLYRPKAIEAGTRREFVAVLEQLLDELYDPHTHLAMNFGDSWRLPPHDIWAEWRAGSAFVVEVRRGSAAAQAGVRAGDEITELNDRPIRELLAGRLGHCLTRQDPAADQWALLSLLAGRHNSTRKLTLRSPAGATRECSIGEEPSPGESVVFESRRLSNGFGYVHFGSFADEGLVAQFDAALAALKDTRGLIIDVRDNTGGDMEIALPIAARLINRKAQYAWMAQREGAGLGRRWPEFIPTRGPWTYRQPVVVVVNHWSMSMAEGFAMGLDGIGRARVVGTRMAGLGAGVHRLQLPHSKIGMQVSAEPVYQLNGSLRSDFLPAVPVDLESTDSLRSADPILNATVAELQRMTAGSTIHP